MIRVDFSFTKNRQNYGKLLLHLKKEKLCHDKRDSKHKNEGSLAAG